MCKTQAARITVSVFALIIFVLGLGAKTVNKSVQIELLDTIIFWHWIGAIILGFLLLF